VLIDGVAHSWRSHGRVLAPDPKTPWLASCAGSAGTLSEWDGDEGYVYVSGRDEKNRSLIGRIVISVRDTPKVVHVDPEPVFRFGSLGAFDENGVSYPSLVQHEGELRLYYAGWMPSVLTPFQNHIGLAIARNGGSFERVSRAPILPRSDADHLWLGSMYVTARAGGFHMWYTACLEWTPTDGDPLHKYLIKYAYSEDGVTWQRDDEVAIDFASKDEFAIARPSLIHADGRYHMWFCSRGEEYRLGYAVSADGREWERRDDALGFTASGDPWDAKAQCYPCVFRANGRLFMLYNGNGYGRDGLGISELSR
jgi:predicted GH43/DUF377 family glycosyl hydrolase